ncbi:RNA polymerase sigma factor [Alisedimentitalea sp. MJ-SS2]|uniref:RNA polymerase sigma factor n=1 Tax=Aliisedimentitalea sp. MJ-SS2 TaxID=3049795 RepID=UPI002907FCEA|nr:RNA polymerase sigma factor [Alisedimentitalea sp. MJ-SS2]MDU8927129.1 RNA polymerase sigma factor [Alisedimentitalea sp. MJ-SS2]
MTMPLDTHADVPDEALLTLFANGDGAAAQALTHRFTPVVMAHAFRLLGDRAEAEDVAQETMLRLWKIAPEWRRGEAKVTTWLYRVVANLATDRLRKRGRGADGHGPALDDVPEPVDGAMSAEERLQTQARADALQGALDKLPERQRQAVVLRHIEGLGNPEIAEVMAISTEAVESLTARGKRSLSAALAGRRDELGYGDD